MLLLINEKMMKMESTFGDLCRICSGFDIQIELFADALSKKRVERSLMAYIVEMSRKCQLVFLLGACVYAVCTMYPASATKAMVVSK